MSDVVQSVRRLKSLKSTARVAMTAAPRVFASADIAARLLTHLDDPQFARLWARAQPHTLLDMFRAKQILDHARAALELPGDFIECGVADGGISLLLACLLEEMKSDKRVFVCDSFQGLPTPDRRVDKDYAAGEFAVSADRVRAMLNREGVLDRCVIVEGWFEDTLPNLAPELRLAFAHIDCDLYHPALTCLKHLSPRLQAGAPMVFDDYLDGSEGIFRAVNGHVAVTGEQVRLGPTCQATVIQGERPQPDAYTLMLNETGQVDPSGFTLHISLADLQANGTYKAYLGIVRDDLVDRADDITAQLAVLDEPTSS